MSRRSSRQRLVVIIGGLAVVAIGATVVGILRSPEMRQQFADLVEPLAVTQIGQFTDGGTLTVTLEDAEGVELPICVNRRLIEDEAGEFANPTFRRIYLGRGSPESDDAFLVAQGGYAERRIERALGAWLGSDAAREATQRLQELRLRRRPKDGRPPEAYLVEAVLESLRHPDRGTGSGPWDGFEDLPDLDDAAGTEDESDL
jgi:hypothetical protein